MRFTLGARLTAEFVGTGFLVATVVGSGIMGERLAGGNAAIALLANTLATGAVLVALICSFEAISGAHFNPVVTLAGAIEVRCSWSRDYWIHRGSGCGRNHRDCDRKLNVRAAGVVHVAARTPWVAACPERVCCNLRVAYSHPGVFAPAAREDSGCSRRLYNRCLLVYSVNVVCEPGSYDCALSFEYICWDSRGGCSPVRCRTDSRWASRNLSFHPAEAGDPDSRIQQR